MHEINPVLAGTFDAPAYAPANNFAQATNSSQDVNDVSGVTGPDPRRYTKFDHSDTEAGSATLSFSDVLDMVNPLEHIPVISSVYRAITGEEINPVARVAGDILYGGAFGAASAVFSGVSAVADAGLEQQTGKDSGGLAIAALFGPGDKNDNVQLADVQTKTNATLASAATPAPVGNQASTAATQKIELAQAAAGTPLLAALAVPANMPPPPPRSTDTASPDVVVPNSQTAPSGSRGGVASSSAPSAAMAPPVPAPAVSQNTPAPVAGVSLASAETAAGPAALGGIPMAGPKSSPSGKQPFGWVMGTPNAQAQDMALALSQGAPTTRMGHMIYTNKLTSGLHPLPPMLSAGNAKTNNAAPVIAPAPVLPASYTPPSSGPSASAFTGSGQTLAVAGTSPSSGASSTAVPAALMQEMMIKALSQYGKIATAPASNTGSGLNLVN